LGLCYRKLLGFFHVIPRDIKANYYVKGVIFFLKKSHLHFYGAYKTVIRKITITLYISFKINFIVVYGKNKKVFVMLILSKITCFVLKSKPRKLFEI